MTATTQINLRAIEVFRPYNNEILEDLLWNEGADDVEVNRWLQAPILRVAKRGEEVLAMYAMTPGDRVTYQLYGVVVHPSVRRQGLGRWLVGHAIGVAESKGARHVRFAQIKATRFFGNIGFVAEETGQRFDLIPE